MVQLYNQFMAHTIHFHVGHDEMRKISPSRANKYHVSNELPLTISKIEKDDSSHHHHHHHHRKHKRQVSHFFFLFIEFL